MKGRKQNFSFIIWSKLNFEPFPDTALDFFPEGKHLVHFKQKKIKISHPHSQAKNEEQKSWDLTRRKDIQGRKLTWSDMWKIKTTHRPLTKVPIRQPWPLHPTLSPCSLQLGGFISEELCQHLPRETQSEHVLPSNATRRCRWHAGSIFLWVEKGSQPQPVPLVSI